MKTTSKLRLLLSGILEDSRTRAEATKTHRLENEAASRRAEDREVYNNWDNYYRGQFLEEQLRKVSR